MVDVIYIRLVAFGILAKKVIRTQFRIASLGEIVKDFRLRILLELSKIKLIHPIKDWVSIGLQIALSEYRVFGESLCINRYG